MADSITGFSAFRKAVWSCMRVTVTPAAVGGSTTMLIEALDPTQSAAGISSTASPTVMDNITLSLTAGPPAATPEVGSTVLVGLAGAATLGGGAYALHRRNERQQLILPGQRLN